MSIRDLFGMKRLINRISNCGQKETICNGFLEIFTD